MNDEAMHDYACQKIRRMGMAHVWVRCTLIGFLLQIFVGRSYDCWRLDVVIV